MKLTDLSIKLGKLLHLQEKDCDIGFKIFELKQKAMELEIARKHIVDKKVRVAGEIEKEWATAIDGKVPLEDGT